MGNFLGLCALTGSKKTVLQVMKMNDGKILEFQAPIRVRDLLVKYPNSYVGTFKEATQPLPLDYKLKIGNTSSETSCNSTGGGVHFSMHGGENRDEVGRIKLVITKKQLAQLLSKQMTLEDVIMEVSKRPSKLVVSSTSNVHKLEAIPEEVEGAY
ncbi:hypothetical protein Cgig2_019319 [Carnegiea gigantea]|uniref:Uncharacterized protein n=1 Tax=Carnegiea gigantea TaxID=171969 RepID=A0A9Q1KL27_9CARY|nr:hypothetical protein Cgig2_019319 [Carnegiea gigantea]